MQIKFGALRQRHGNEKASKRKTNKKNVSFQRCFAVNYNEKFEWRVQSVKNYELLKVDNISLTMPKYCKYADINLFVYIYNYMQIYIIEM